MGEISERIRFAKEKNLQVYIESEKGTHFSAFVYDIDPQYHRFFWGNDPKPAPQEKRKWMRFENVSSVRFNKAGEQAYQEVKQTASFSKRKLSKKQIESYFQYYQEIVRILRQENQEDTQKSQDTKDQTEIHLNNRAGFLAYCQKNITVENEGLLLSFLSGKLLQEPAHTDAAQRPILLLEPSNLSQKQAVEKALCSKISVIEGPPGTGKTTTILSLIANYVYRNKRICVISKNNAAIDNVLEKLERLPLPHFYVRMGNALWQKEMLKSADTFLWEYAQALLRVQPLSQERVEQEETGLLHAYDTLKQTEETINTLVKLQNEADELEIQLRHLTKRESAFHELFTGKIPFWFRFLKTETVKKFLDRVAGRILKYSDSPQKHISFLDKIEAAFLWRISPRAYYKQMLLLKWKLEILYAQKKHEEIQSKIAEGDLEKRQRETQKDYVPYTKKSQQLLKDALIKNTNAVDLCAQLNILKTTLKDAAEDTRKQAYETVLKRAFPVFLTTADALLQNFSELKTGEQKFDCIIMDEATQCDVLTGLTPLFYAKSCVVVGDSRQLSAITGENEGKVAELHIPQNLRYYGNNFLSAVRAAFQLEPTLLREHYRCDYNIIQFCNHFFYDNELIVYKAPHRDAMQIIDVSAGKYAQRNGSSFSNAREVEVIREQSGKALYDTFAITPFRAQSYRLNAAFRDENEKNRVGTIHTFQGREASRVFLSTVLNDLDFCNNHLRGKHNLFTKELVNVAVSRAIDSFTLVTDRNYFQKHSKLIRDLILYIEKYGKKIPDTTVCLFDGLYKDMPAYTQQEDCSNPFELALWKSLQRFSQQHTEVSPYIKMPLAELVTDRHYLDAFPSVKAFVLNERTHVDFVLENTLGNPMLAIELDGELHRRPEQIRRDRMKDAALAHMNIPLLRLQSKNAFSEETLFTYMENVLQI